MDEQEELKDSEAPAESAIPTIRTMQSDAKFYVKKKKLSAVDIAAQNYAGQEGRLRVGDPKSYRSLFIMGGFIAVLGTSVVGWWYFFGNANVATLPPAMPKAPASIIRTEGETELLLSPINVRAFLDSLNREQELARPAGSVIYLPIAQNIDSTKTFPSALEFFQTLEIKPPSSFLDTLLPTFYTFAYRDASSGSLALVFRTKDYELTFSSLLFWERTMPRNLERLIRSSVDITGLPKTFSDRIIKNHDARVLADTSGKSVLAYALFNKNLLVLATSDEALAAVLERMIAIPPQ